MTEEPANEITTSTNRTADVGSANRRDRIRTARHCMSIYYRANARLTFLKTRLRREYSALREAHPCRTEARALLVEFNRLAGHSLINPEDELWATIREFLTDAAHQRPLQLPPYCALAAAMAWQKARNRTVVKFAQRVDALIMEFIGHENAPVS